MIRIEIGAMPPLLRSIVRSALETERDMAVLAPTAGAQGRGGPRVDNADVLIVCSDRELDGGIPIGQLTASRSGAIVALDSTGAAATIVRVTAERTPIAGASDLRDAVRLAANRSGTAN